MVGAEGQELEHKENVFCVFGGLLSSPQGQVASQ